MGLGIGISFNSYSKITMACGLCFGCHVWNGLRNPGGRDCRRSLGSSSEQGQKWTAWLQSGSGWRSVHKVHTEMLVIGWLQGGKALYSRRRYPHTFWLVSWDLAKPLCWITSYENLVLDCQGWTFWWSDGWSEYVQIIWFDVVRI